MQRNTQIFGTARYIGAICSSQTSQDSVTQMLIDESLPSERLMNAIIPTTCMKMTILVVVKAHRYENTRSPDHVMSMFEMLWEEPWHYVKFLLYFFRAFKNIKSALLEKWDLLLQATYFQLVMLFYYVWQ